jgi:hypothetical protein
MILVSTTAIGGFLFWASIGGIYHEIRSCKWTGWRRPCHYSEPRTPNTFQFLWPAGPGAGGGE